MALEIVTGLPTKVDFSALHMGTYTEPEVAQIGLTGLRRDSTAMRPL